MPFRSTGRSTGQRSYFLPLSPPVDRLGRLRLDTESRALYRSTDPVDRHRALLSISNFGRPGGRSAREPLLSGSSLGRPVGSTVQNLTVGRSTAWSTGRAFQPFPAANGQNFVGAINTPHLSWFSTSFSRAKILILSSV